MLCVNTSNDIIITRTKTQVISKQNEYVRNIQNIWNNTVSTATLSFSLSVSLSLPPSTLLSFCISKLRIREGNLAALPWFSIRSRQNVSVVSTEVHGTSRWCNRQITDSLTVYFVVVRVCQKCLLLAEIYKRCKLCFSCVRKFRNGDKQCDRNSFAIL